MAGHQSPHGAESVATLQASIRHHMRYALAKEWQHLSGPNLFKAVALAARARLVDRMLATEAHYHPIRQYAQDIWQVESILEGR